MVESAKRKSGVKLVGISGNISAEKHSRGCGF